MVTVRMPRYPYAMNSPAAWEAYWWEINYGHSGHRGYFTVCGIIGWVHDQLSPMKSLLRSYAKLGAGHEHEETKVLIERALLDRATRVAWLLDEVYPRTRMDRWAHIFIDTMDAMCRTTCGDDHELVCVEERVEWQAEFEAKGLNRLPRQSFRTMAHNRRLPDLKSVLSSLYDVQSQVVHGKTLHMDGRVPVATGAQNPGRLVEVVATLMLSYVSSR